MNNFTINDDGKNVTVEQKDERNFTIYSNEGEKYLHLKQDNEGGNHWFEGASDNETAKTIKLGKAIEAYLASK